MDSTVDCKSKRATIALPPYERDRRTLESTPENFEMEPRKKSSSFRILKFTQSDINHLSCWFSSVSSCNSGLNSGWLVKKLTIVSHSGLSEHSVSIHVSHLESLALSCPVDMWQTETHVHNANCLQTRSNCISTCLDGGLSSHMWPFVRTWENGHLKRCN